ncbi:MAG: ELWxxDGT repeat protein [Chitinophagaceae bacterium]
MKKLLLVFYLATITLAAAGQQFSLLKDINPGSASSNICYLTNVDNMLFFAANNGIKGMELWKSDGTEAGTVLVKDIYTGSSSSSIGYLTHVNHKLFFVANNGATGTELWKSDGTEAGTVLVNDIRSGPMGSNPSNLVNVNGILFFSADDGINGVELWKSDGTAAGTTMIKDINPLSGSSYPQSLANANGTLYFAADGGPTGMEIWKSDGTSAGTVLVKDIWTGDIGSYPFDLMNVGGTIFFSADDGINGTELWKSDGTAAGTVLVKDIWSGSGGSYPFSMKSVDGLLFFSADNGIKGAELWKSDGTGAGTVLVKDVWPGAESGAVGNFSRLINKLVFTGNDGVNGYKTWQSDGSSEGTKIASGIADAGDGDIQELVETDNRIFASIRQTNIGRELWVVNYTSILPLDIIEFKGRLEKTDAVLNWKTGNEINTEEFVVERSINGSNYTPVGNVKSANTPGVHSYSFTDLNVVDLGTDIVYYRLKQRDVDSRSTYSKVVTLSISKKTGVDLYPNPAMSAINLTVVAQRKEKMIYQVFDNIGKIVIQDSRQILSGINRLPVDINKLPAGVYYIRLSSNSILKRFQFVKY